MTEHLADAPDLVPRPPALDEWHSLLPAARLEDMLARFEAALTRPEALAEQQGRESDRLSYTIPEAAGALRVSRRTVERLNERRQLRCVFVSGARRISRETIVRFLRDQETRGTGRRPAALRMVAGERRRPRDAR